jgi:hypothetical protein
MNRNEMIYRPPSTLQSVFVGVSLAPWHSTAVLLDVGSHEPVSVFRVSLAPGGRSLRRFRAYGGASDRLVEQLAVHGTPAILAIEGYGVMGCTWDQVTLLEWSVLLRLRILCQDWRLAEVPATALRKFITGKGLAGGKLLRARLASAFGQTFFDDQEAEAYALAQAARCLARPADHEPWRRAMIARVIRPVRVAGLCETAQPVRE